MRVLLFSPMFFGHPVVYCRVYTKILLEHGCTVILASFGLANFNIAEWPEVALIAAGGFEVADLGGEISPSAGPLSAEELVALQRARRVDVTVFMHADYFRDQFVRIASRTAPRLYGRNIGIFSLTAAWYPGEDNLTGKPASWIAPTVRTSLGNLKRLVTDRQRTDRYFFEQQLLKQEVLSVLLVKDERAAQRFAAPVHWMPEIYKVFGEVPTAEGERQCESFAARYETFRTNCLDKEVLLYFGNAAWYKGYDYALALAVREPDVAFVHCGAADLGDGKFLFDVGAMRTQLQSEGRFFETREFLRSQALIELFFLSAKRMVSTHRLAGTSGTMLQAVEFGKPLLTPNTGLLGWRTETFRLGLTYRHGDLEDLSRKWHDLHNQDAGYGAHLNTFIQKFSEDAVIDCVTRHVLGSAEAA